ncbi:hypothetical protein BKA61DRAFT_708256 [Leptodontidium sp. MPI-SDFR-AT-0119]|nr:hypothetical protein BKA61DRAFT_708256 [Leptodontidium sp. MPI-SDFR-AT-0119]
MSSIPDEKAHEDREKSGPEAEEESGSDDDSKHDSKNEGGNITPMKSLVKLAEEAVIKSLSKAVDGEQVTARYCCGGSIPGIGPRSTTSESKTGEDTKVGKGKKKEKDGRDQKVEEQSKNEKVSKDRKDPASEARRNAPVVPAVTIRWDDPTGHCMTRRLKIASETPLRGNKLSGTYHLIDACGREGLDQSKFTVDFHPQDHGILDGITQILLPGWKGRFLREFPEHRGVKVERCRLHVSTASTASKIDVGSSPELLGRLIICLPCPHKGGQLTLSDDGHSSVFDWSSSENPSIHWVAFTNRCKHEFSPVTKGAQILLVYDLIVTERVGGSLVSGHVTDPTLSPLYRGVRDMLLEPGFMTDGGTLGYYCQYPYSHNSPRMGKRLPHALQGVDMVLYSVFKSLGLEVQVRPILDREDLDVIDEKRTYREWAGDSEEYEKRVKERWDLDCCKVGDAFHVLDIGEYDTEYNDKYLESVSFDENLPIIWPMKEHFGVTWLNTPYIGDGKKPRELAVIMEYLPYDGQYNCCDECEYAHHFERIHSLVGMMVFVPKLADRNLDV